jgi:outer membrane protein assembly factor BamB
MNINPIILIIFLLCLFSCDKSPRLKSYPDPYLDSFRGRGIKYMISFDPHGYSYTDTTTFDSSGNIVHSKGFGLIGRKAYDSLNFITHLLTINDIPSNYLIEYSFNKDGDLVQVWNRVNHLNWSLDDSDIGKAERAVKFDLDKERRIAQEIDTTSNEYTQFNYGEEGCLVSKEVYSINSKNLLKKWEYFYDQKVPSKLSKINLSGTSHGSVLVQYFSDGLLDSIATINGHLTKYRYIYY